MSHREMDQAADLHRLLASLDADLADARKIDPVPLALVRALRMERDKVAEQIAAQEQAAR